MAKKALFVVGGWDGHTPFESANLFAALLSKEGYSVEISDTLDVFLDQQKLNDLDLIVPVWTMGTIRQAQVGGLQRGVGVADMARAIAQGIAHRASGALAFHVLDAMQAFEESSLEGQEIQLTSAPF